MIFFLISLLVLTLLYTAFILWCWTGWKKLKTVHPAASFQTKVSVIIPVRNEEENISNCMAALIHQRFPVELMEILVSDDHSEDGTEARVQDMIRKFPGNKISFLKKEAGHPGNLYKKEAITEAIQKSTGELIVTTDADCLMTENWLTTIVSYYEKEKPWLIAGPVCFDEGKSILEKIQALEFAGLIGIGAGSISNKMPVMCNGANLAYQKKIFNEVNGFSDLSGSVSGDDTQLMMKISAKDPAKIHFLKSQDAVVSTPAMSTLKSLLQQRRRWASKIPTKMSALTVLVAVIAWLLHTGLVLAFSTLFFDPSYGWFVISIFLLKIIPEYLLLRDVTDFFERGNPAGLFLCAQLFYPFYIFFIGVISPFTSYQWKGREINPSTAKATTW